ncbi:MAG: hypothetical protein WCJ30_10630 [Deltaproteobacteria bacterium]
MPTPVVHGWASVPTHGVTHRPPVHSSPPQQSRAFRQVAPALRHAHLPPTQVSSPQQVVSEAQVPPVPTQHCIGPAAEVCLQPIASVGQHSVRSAHVLPSVVHAEHVPPRQRLPAQQSTVNVHVAPVVRHAHRELVHSICPQQSVATVHAPPASRQQCGVTGFVRHERPGQQPAPAHAAATAVHAAWQLPARQSSVAVHVCPHVPQLP